MDEINVQYFLDATRPSGWKAYNPGSGSGARTKALAGKYDGTDGRGAILVQTLIDVRATFLAGDGLRFQEKSQERRQAEGQSKEMKIIQETIRWNNLDREWLFSLAKEAELEGRLLFRISKAATIGDAVPPADAYEIQHLPFCKYNYTVVMREDDACVIDHVEYRKKGGGKETLYPGEFVLHTFGSGRYYEPNKVFSRVAGCLEDIDIVVCARNDLREINHLFAHPTPVIQVKEAREVAPLQKALEQLQWKIGTMLVTNADYKLVGIDTAGTSQLLEEEKAAVLRIAGTSGVPAFFLGHTEALSNRATAYVLLETLDVNVRTDRHGLETMFNDIFYTVLKKAGKAAGVEDPQAIVATIPPPLIIQQQSTEKAASLLEMYKERAISLRTLLAAVHEVSDVEQEIRNIKTESMSLTPSNNTNIPPSQDLKPAIEGLVSGVGGAVIDYIVENAPKGLLQK